MSVRYDPSSSACNLSFGRGKTNKPVWAFHQAGNSCTQQTWVKPHQLLVLSDVLVESIDPTTHKSKLVATLSGFYVSPNGKWMAGTGPGDPKVSPEAETVYVLSVGARKCLVVPGRSADAAGFTPDSRNVIVRRAYHNGHLQLRQFALASLGSDCPTGANGVLPTRS